MSPRKTEELDPKSEIDKLMDTDEWKKFDKLLKKVDVKPVKSPFSTLPLPEYLRTGTVLDKLLGGGIKRGQVVELYGNFGSGKTQICFTLTVESKGLVVWIDAEGTFSVPRITQIAKERGKDIADLDKRVLLYSPTDWKEQIAIPHQLPDVKEIELIVVDSLLAHFRVGKDFLGRQNLVSRQGIIRTHLSELRQIAKKYNAMVVITNQITQTPNAMPFTPLYMLEQGVGGPSVHHMPDTIIYLRRAKDPKRVARLMDSSEVANEEVAFKISEKGIEDIPLEEKEKENLTTEIEVKTAPEEEEDGG